MQDFVIMLFKRDGDWPKVHDRTTLAVALSGLAYKQPVNNAFMRIAEHLLTVLTDDGWLMVTPMGWHKLTPAGVDKLAALSPPAVTIP